MTDPTKGPNIHVVCACGQKLSVPSAHAGGTGQCSRCKQPVRIPRAGPIPDLLFERIAVDAGYVKAEDLTRCLKIQAEGGPKGARRPIGEILVEQGALTDKKARWILENRSYVEIRAEDQKLGALAAKNGFIDEAARKDALEVQRSTYLTAGKTLRLGEILVERGLLEPQQVKDLWAAQAPRSAATVAEPSHPSVATPAKTPPQTARASARPETPLPPATPGGRETPPWSPAVEQTGASVRGPQPKLKACPYCNEEILAVAKKCRHCGEFLDPQLAAQKQASTDAQARKGSPAPSSGIVSKILGGFVAIVLLLGVLPVIGGLFSGLTHDVQMGGNAATQSAHLFNNALTAANESLARHGEGFVAGLSQWRMGTAGSDAVRRPYDNMVGALQRVESDMANVKVPDLASARELYARHQDFLRGQRRMIEKHLGDVVRAIEDETLDRGQVEAKMQEAAQSSAEIERPLLIKCQEAQRRFANEAGIQLR